MLSKSLLREENENQVAAGDDSLSVCHIGDNFSRIPIKNLLYLTLPPWNVVETG